MKTNVMWLHQNTNTSSNSALAIDGLYISLSLSLARPINLLRLVNDMVMFIGNKRQHLVFAFDSQKIKIYCANALVPAISFVNVNSVWFALGAQQAKRSAHFVWCDKIYFGLFIIICFRFHENSLDVDAVLIIFPIHRKPNRCEIGFFVGASSFLCHHHHSRQHHTISVRKLSLTNQMMRIVLHHNINIFSK